MLPATPMFPMTKSVIAKIQSPPVIQYIAKQDATPIPMKMPSSRFLIGELSAIAPRMGAMIATMMIAMADAQASRADATFVTTPRVATIA